MELKEYINKNNLIYPDYNNLNIVSLVRYLYSNYGMEFNDKNIERFKSIIPRKKHTILILVDGMGSNLINVLNDNSILKQNKKEDIITVCPSSTGCVLTSLATAEYPSEHGIIGWYNYNRKHNIDYYPLLFTTRKTNENLKEINITEKEIFKNSSKLNNLKVKTTVFYPDFIFDSVYSNYVAKDNIRKSYSDLEDAFNQIIEITKQKEETFTYLYIPDIDNLEHENGFNNKIVLDKIAEIENQISRIKQEDVVTIVTADHGQTNIDDDIIMDFEKYEKYFYAYPSIDFAMASFYIKKENETEFVKEFNKDYKDKMYLFKTEEFVKGNFFGPDKPSKYLLDNLGEYISFCNVNAQFINSPEIEEYYGITKGNHSGLTSDEMVIPLIIINN